jgi:hypothetical protein
MADTVVWGEVAGRSITFPMEVPDVNVATVMFDVPSQAASALLPGEAFTVVESQPGVTQLVVAACDYRDNPWGDYDEINLGLMAQPTGADIDTAGTFVWRMPVNQEFTCEAGNQVMGFPKTVEDIAVGYRADTVTFTLVCDGSEALRLTVPRQAGGGDPVRISAVSYSYLGGDPFGTVVDMDMGVPVDPQAVTLELGGGQIADELRSLGLPTEPVFASWGEGLSAVFQLGQPVQRR